ncbi:MAG: glycosyltransferase family 39 protein [Chloroflexota bacterium]
MTHWVSIRLRPQSSLQFLLITLFLILGSTYSIINPLFEAPDEVWHYEYIRWLAEGKGLPQAEDFGIAPWAQEGSQPPLYYALGALLTIGISTDNANNAIQYNPHVVEGDATAFGNKNKMIHGHAHQWPWRGVVLAAHLVRFFSVCLGAWTIYCVWQIATLLAQNAGVANTTPYAFMAASLVAFNPQFLFISASISNDNLVTAVCTTGLWMLMRLLSCKTGMLAWLGIGICVGLAFLSKLNGVLLGVAVFYAWIVYRASESTLKKSAERALSSAGQSGIRECLPPQFYTFLYNKKSAERALSSAGQSGIRECLPPQFYTFLYNEKIQQALFVSIPVLLIAGWWYVRNWLLFDDPTGISALTSVLPARPEPLRLDELWTLAPGVWRSFWGVFGWFNIVAEPWFYAVYNWICIVGFSGAIIGVFMWLLRSLPNPLLLGEGIASRASDSNLGAGTVDNSLGEGTAPPPNKERLGRGVLHQVILLLFWLTGMILLLAYWGQVNYPQGRLLFPAVGALMPLLAWGLLNWMPSILQWSVSVILSIGLFILAVYAPFRWIVPTYATPPLMAADTTLPTPVDVQFGPAEAPVARLVGYDLRQDEATPGEPVELTLYWQAMTSVSSNYSIFLHATDDVGILQAQRDTYPAKGSLVTSEWPLDQMIVDQHRLDIPTTAHAPARLRFDIGLYTFETGQRLPIRVKATPESDIADVGEVWTLGYVALQPSTTEALPTINFDDTIALVDYQLDKRTVTAGETLTLTLQWEALIDLADDYKVFTHLVLPPGAVWAQDDQTPQDGQSPTSTWVEGQRVDDTYLLTLPENAPSGTYFVEVGLYHEQTWERLRVNLSTKGVVLGHVKVIESSNQ